jgi:hypothetical protein
MITVGTMMITSTASTPRAMPMYTPTLGLCLGFAGPGPSPPPVATKLRITEAWAMSAVAVSVPAVTPSVVSRGICVVESTVVEMRKGVLRAAVLGSVTVNSVVDPMATVFVLGSPAHPRELEASPILTFRHASERSDVN